MSTSDEYKVDVYLPILDSFLGELKECFSTRNVKIMKARFSTRNVKIMKAIQACSPQSKDFLDPDSLLHSLTENYSMDHSSLTMEAKLAKRTLAGKSKQMETISDVLLELQPLQAAFPTLVKLLQIALTICVSSAQCERCFSALKRIK